MAKEFTSHKNRTMASIMQKQCQKRRTVNSPFCFVGLFWVNPTPSTRYATLPLLLLHELMFCQLQLGCSLQNEYTSHYVRVKKKLASRETCQSDLDFDVVEGMTNYFPAEVGEDAQGDEIVLFNCAHVLPRYIVHYSIVSSRFCLLLFLFFFHLLLF